MTKSTGKFSPDTVPSSNPNLGQTGILQFDDVLQEIGEFGRYQILNGILTCLITAISTCALFNFVFSAAFLDHRFVKIFNSFSKWNIGFGFEMIMLMTFLN